MIYFLVALLLRTLFIVFLKEIKGAENLPPKGGFIIAANHIGPISPLYLVTALVPYLKRKIHFIARVNRAWRWFGSFIMINFLGCIPLRNANKEKTLIIAEEYLRKGKIIGIFPEGGENHTLLLLKGKTGAVRLALETGCPILPVGIKGPKGQAFPEAYKNLFLYGRKKVIIKVGSPLYFKLKPGQKVTKELLDNLTRILMKKIGQLCDKEYIY